MREALDAIGLPSDALLQHGSPRLVYGIALASNFREVLLGRDRRPKYLLRGGPSTTDAIANFWRVRWLAKRVSQPEVIGDIQSNTLSYPIRHGGRVALPGHDQQLPLLPELFDASPHLRGPESDVLRHVQTSWNRLRYSHKRVQIAIHA